MKINAELVKKLRTEKSWSQEELAIVSGLNLRTIQRVEKEASASLQSKKSLASALEIDIQDLNFHAMLHRAPVKITDSEVRFALTSDVCIIILFGHEKLRWRRDGQDTCRGIDAHAPDVGLAPKLVSLANRAGVQGQA